LKSQISNLKSQISNLKSQITNLKSQISDLKFRIRIGMAASATACPACNPKSKTANPKFDRRLFPQAGDMHQAKRIMRQAHFEQTPSTPAPSTPLD
jgi:phage shock protein A